MGQSKKKRLLLLDRSELTENVLKLLLAGEAITVTRLRQESLANYLRKHPVDAFVINSNFIALNEADFWQSVQNTVQLQQLPKIFLCREDEMVLTPRLLELKQSVTATRPFHPVEFKHFIAGVLKP